ncbi:TetR/AcrR family transcriptional regulator [Nocardiopsis composta]
MAAAAGIAKGSVYLYYESREALLTAVFERWAERSRAVVEAALSGERPAMQRLEELLRSVIALLAGEPGLTRVMLDLWAAGRRSEGGAPPPFDMAAVYREYRTVVAALLREAAEEGAVRAGAGEPEAAVVVGAIEGCLVQWVVDPEFPFAEIADQMVEVCTRGVLRGAAGGAA